MALVDVLNTIATYYTPSKGGVYGIALLDPCMGDGSSIRLLREKIFHSDRPKIYGVEINEELGCVAASDSSPLDRVARGDFFKLCWEPDYSPMCMFVWCDPPSFQEKKFLERSSIMLDQSGIMVYHINHKALAQSAELLARQYRSIRVFSIPNSQYDCGSDNCVVMAIKRSDQSLDSHALETLNSYASDFTSIPVLKNAGLFDLTSIPYRYHSPSSWTVKPIDTYSINQKYFPWMSDKGPIAGMDLPDQISDSLNRKFPLASKPRATHIASALSAGVFNGMRVEPNPEYPEYPPILVKGTFDKVYKTVEDKLDKDGMKIGELQAQHPALRVTVLDLSQGEFHDIATDSSGDNISNMSLRDLLDTYGQSLMRGMLDMCPVLHDPNNDPNPIPMPDLARPLYAAQEDAVRTIIKLRKENPQNGVLILGEIGSGKTSLTIASAKALGHKRTLVVCPPHLLSGWEEQISIVTPEAKVYILESLSEVDKFMAEKDFCFGILSRERAKLMHGWKSNVTHCPKCYSRAPIGQDLAKNKVCCSSKNFTPKNQIASWIQKNGNKLIRYCPNHNIRNTLHLSARHLQSLDKATPEPFTPDADMFRELIPLLGQNWSSLSVLTWAVPSLTQDAYNQNSNSDRNNLSKYEMLRAIPESEFLPLLDISSNYIQESFVREHRNIFKYGYIPYNSGISINRNQEVLRYGAALASNKALDNLLSDLYSAAEFEISECGEPLYQATNPVRYPFAKYIKNRGKNGFDLLVIDEAHEVSNNMDSAQSNAASILCGMNKPTFFLTGTSMNGYAESMFQMLRNLSPKFRSSFSREDLSDFIDQYGYWKQIVSHKDGKESTRRAGVAPGVLPVLTLEQVLPMAVTLQKEDLALNIPDRKDDRVDLFVGGKLYENYKYLLNELTDTIKRTRNAPGLAGKLWGALARLPFYMDIAPLGNTDHGTFEIRWPKDSLMNGALVAEVPALGYDTILPKENWMLSTIADEVAEGRNVIVMCYHTALLDRYLEIISQRGFSVRVMESDKISPAKRMEWITKNVVKPKIQVLICNPVAIQTGLNNLVHFSTEIWMENPMCNPQIYRQACGRIDRIGQQKETKIMFPVYKNTAQLAQHKLLMHKVGVSSAVDGLDPEEALKAAGVLDSDFNGFSVGKQLYKMITEAD